MIGKTLFFALSILTMPWLLAQEENMIDEVIVADKKQDVYKILKKVSRIFKKNMDYSKVYHVDFQITNSKGERWIDFTAKNHLTLYIIV